MAIRDPSFDNDGTAGDGMANWQHSLDYVAKLNAENYLNHNDWRLPTIQELSTLVDSNVSSPGPTIHTSSFPGTEASSYWSSATFVNNIYYAWYVFFQSGAVSFGNKTNVGYVRAVRAG